MDNQISIQEQRKIVKDFAKAHGYTNIRHKGRWQSYEVYHVFCRSDIITENINGVLVPVPTGLPNFILYKDGIARFANNEERDSVW